MIEGKNIKYPGGTMIKRHDKLYSSHSRETQGTYLTSILKCKIKC